MTNLGKIAAFVLVGLVLAFTTACTQELSGLKIKAESGDANAQNSLGVMYYNGQGVPKDFSKA